MKGREKEKSAATATPEASPDPRPEEVHLCRIFGPASWQVLAAELGYYIVLFYTILKLYCTKLYYTMMAFHAILYDTRLYYARLVPANYTMSCSTVYTILREAIIRLPYP